jgi:hypothetical protein
LHANKFVFENELLPATAFQRRQHVIAVGLGSFFFFSRLISLSVFDILQIRSLRTQIYSTCIVTLASHWLRTFVYVYKAYHSHAVDEAVT